MMTQRAQEKLTDSLLTEFGFGSAVRRIVAEEIDRADETEGSDAEQANRNGLRGFLPDGAMQNAAQAQEAVSRILTGHKETILKAIRGQQYAVACQELGMALHTVRAVCLHRFEAWAPADEEPDSAAPDAQDSAGEAPEDVDVFAPDTCDAGAGATPGPLGLRPSLIRRDANGPATLTSARIPAALGTVLVPAGSGTPPSGLETLCPDVGEAPETGKSITDEARRFVQSLAKEFESRDRDLWQRFRISSGR